MKPGQDIDQHGVPPLLVRLEDGLISTDPAWEAFFLMLGRNPLLLFVLPLWLKDGAGRLGSELLTRFPPEARWLPYHQPLLSYLRDQKLAGRRLVLATALPVMFGRQVAEHLGLFDGIVSLDAAAALSGAGSADQAPADDLPAAFVYVGRTVDDPIVDTAVGIVQVGSEKSGRPDDSKTVVVEETIVLKSAGWRTYAKAARVHQWLKNLLIFVPLITAHQVGDSGLFLRALCAFFSFSFSASAIYLLNDLIDLPADRKHRNKCSRPLASGRLSIKRAALAIPLLIVAACIIGLYPGPRFLFVIAVYIALTTLYSCWLKKLVVVDVVVLALLYTMRLLAGGAAVSIMPSFWLLSFAMFIFFSLALMKRSADLVLGRSNGQDLMEGRGYMAGDAAIVQMSGVASGYMSVLVLALYINSEDVRLLYTHPELIWLLCPLLFYWISRVWLITSRGKMTEDPVLFTIRDRASQVVAVITAIILWCAT